MTPDAVELRDRNGLPGLIILQYSSRKVKKLPVLFCLRWKRCFHHAGIGSLKAVPVIAVPFHL